MPNPFDILFEEEEREPEQYEEVSGAMDCQICRETVSEGRYYPIAELLTWTCSKGHRSKIRYTG